MNNKKNSKNGEKYKTCLSRQGYVIRKNKFTPEEIENIKKELTVTPNVPPGYQQGKPESFLLYKENNNTKIKNDPIWEIWRV